MERKRDGQTVAITVYRPKKILVLCWNHMLLVGMLRPKTWINTATQ